MPLLHNSKAVLNRTRKVALGLASLALPLLALPLRALPAHPQTTIIRIGPETLHANVQRLGINLSGQTYYDSGQMLRNLIFRNPGFEGETWQSILQCKTASQTSCTGANQYTVWPADFLNGAHYEVLSGPATGSAGTVLSSTAAGPAPLGITVKLTPARAPLQKGDFLLIRADPVRTGHPADVKPADAAPGWWTSVSGGATLSTETHDLSPRTPGKQALRIAADGPGQSATVSSYFDTLAGHSFVQLHGSYQLQFRAKPVSASHELHVSLQRLDTAHGLESFIDRTLTLKPGWQDYTLDFTAAEHGSAVGSVALSFTLHGASALLDDVSLTRATRSPGNPTAFRDAVVDALRDFHPGVLRYMDNGTSFGSSLDNLLSPPFARQRAGSSTQSTLQQDVPIGLPEFLTLSEAVGADPWITLPPGLTPTEAAHLIEYLSGPISTPYGARRAALSHPAPWTGVFSTIHLELGNEQWNSGSFAGSTIANPTDYAHRANAVFRAARSSPFFHAQKFDLIIGSWEAVPWWTQQEAAANTEADSIAVAPYLFSTYNAAPSAEAVFGPIFAQPEQLDSRASGLMAQQAHATRAATHPVHLAVYEVNLGTASGSVPQPAVDATVPSIGAGLAVADHMLLMLRDLGVATQCLFALPEYSNGFSNPSDPRETTPLWGSVVDMGGATNLRRPTFLALELINHAILPNMIATHLTGSDPTWNQPAGPNLSPGLEGAHLLQTFAFADGPRRSLVLFNLSRDHGLPVSFAGPNAPTGIVHRTVLTSARITDSNEARSIVKPVSTTLDHFNPAAQQTLPPFSMTVLTWTAPRE